MPGEVKAQATSKALSQEFIEVDKSEGKQFIILN